MKRKRCGSDSAVPRRELSRFLRATPTCTLVCSAENYEVDSLGLYLLAFRFYVTPAVKNKLDHFLELCNF
jgi:hypothetical protein